ncbi:MAG TPA: drug/metabolite exporter YedA, partial [Ktedonobacteraceae bacterium]|nr:drug/metabolite exporter YedA [Ktedonobacteraceae bacterium]
SANRMKDSFQARPLSEALSQREETQAVSTTASKANPIGIVLAILALYIIWGSTYLGIRIAIESIPPLLMMGIRFIVAGGILYLLLRMRGVPNPSRSQWLGSTAVGILLIGGGMGGVATAEQWVPSSVAAVCIATSPLWISLFAGLWGRWPVRFEWLGLGLGFVGVVLLNLGSGLWASPMGAIILLIAPMCWAFGSAWSHHLQLPPGLMASAAQMLIGGIFVAMMGLILGQRITSLSSTQSLLALLYLVVFGSLIAYSAYGYVLRRVRPALATSYAYVNPVVAVCLGVALAGESVTVLTIVAMVVILVAVALISLGPVWNASRNR